MRLIKVARSCIAMLVLISLLGIGPCAGAAAQEEPRAVDAAYVVNEVSSRLNETTDLSEEYRKQGAFYVKYDTVYDVWAVTFSIDWHLLTTAQQSMFVSTFDRETKQVEIPFIVSFTYDDAKQRYTSAFWNSPQARGFDAQIPQPQVGSAVSSTSTLDAFVQMSPADKESYTAKWKPIADSWLQSNADDDILQSIQNLTSYICTRVYYKNPVSDGYMIAEVEAAALQALAASEALEPSALKDMLVFRHMYYSAGGRMHWVVFADYSRTFHSQSESVYDYMVIMNVSPAISVADVRKLYNHDILSVFQYINSSSL